MKGCIGKRELNGNDAVHVAMGVYRNEREGIKA
jgi:hypothetical protein